MQNKLLNRLVCMTPEQIEIEVTVLKICHWETERWRTDELLSRQIERSSAHLRAQKMVLKVLVVTLVYNVINSIGLIPDSLISGLKELISR